MDGVVTGDEELTPDLEEPKDATCPTCGELIPADDLTAHLEGLDRRRLACARQDLHEISNRRKRRTMTIGALLDRPL